MKPKEVTYWNRFVFGIVFLICVVYMRKYCGRKNSICRFLMVLHFFQHPECEKVFVKCRLSICMYVYARSM
jgi:hypothetical protein